MTEELSLFSFQETLDRVIAAKIDHTAGARHAGMTMPPTVVVIYGNPKGGTPIMLASPRAALDLPLRLLVREDPAGRTLVLLQPVMEVLRQAGVPEELAARLEPAQRLVIDAIR
jgi:uncharacterized protein (DUF302 family)